MVQVERQLFTVHKYHKMMETGILTKEDRVELINGEIIKSSPIKSTHASIVDILTEELIFQLRKKAIIRTQNPITLNDFSEPEPDLAVVAFRKDRYRNQHPSPNDTFLVIEVADSTLSTDRTIKIPLYATANIPEYWIVNIPKSQIEIYRTPLDGKYLEKEIIGAKQKAICQSITFEISHDDLF